MITGTIVGNVPVYGVAIQSADRTGPSYRFRSARMYAAADFDDAPSVLDVESIDRETDPREFRMTTSELSFVLRDIAGVVTDVQGNFKDLECTLYAGDYAQRQTGAWSNLLDYATFIALLTAELIATRVSVGQALQAANLYLHVGSGTTTIGNAEMTVLGFFPAFQMFTGIVADVEHVDETFRVTVRSPVVLADGVKLFNVGAAAITTGITGADTSVTVTVAENATVFDDSGVVLIESERVTFNTATDNGDGTWTLGGLTRGYLSSVAAAHAAGVKVQEMVVLGPAHPFDILESLLSDPIGKSGLGMSRYVNSVSIAAAKSAIGSTFEMFFEITEAANAKEWIENQIYRACAAYPYEDNVGRIGVKLLESASTDASIADSDSLSRATLGNNLPRRVNKVVFNYDWDPVEQKFRSSSPYQVDGLVGQAGDFSLIIDAYGIQTDLVDTADLLSERSTAITDRFGLPTPVIEVVTKFAKRLSEIGDDVSVDFARLANPITNTLGLESSADVISVKHMLAEKRMQFSLLLRAPVYDVLAPDTYYSLTSTPTVAIA